MKTDTLQISIIQADLIWEHPERNREQFTTFINNIPQDTQLVVLPEMFTTGFSMTPEPLAETMDGTTLQWMINLAAQKKIAICGSLIIKENGNFYNRFLFVEPEGNVTSYDKRHRFMMAGEGEKYTAGKEQVVIDYLGWKIFPQICYDLRFPVFSRNTADYDLIIFVANWPETRVAAWDTLLKARAIENMSYCVGVNRIGTDGSQLKYTGHSGIYNELGETHIFAKAEEGIFTTTLSKSQMLATREKLPFLRDKDRFTLLQ